MNHFSFALVTACSHGTSRPSAAVPPVPPSAPSHLGRGHRQHDWGRWDQQGRQLRARANPVPVLHAWAQALWSYITGRGSWERVVEAACVPYAVCTLFPGVVDRVALLIGSFECFVGTGADNPGVAIQRTTMGLAVSLSAVLEALRWRYGCATMAAWRAPQLHYTQGSRVSVVRILIAPLWNRVPLPLRRHQQHVPDVWWANPQCTLILFVGWCPSVLAGDEGHAIGLSASGWLACAGRGRRHIGVEPDGAATAVLQWLPDIWEIWYFTLP